MWIYSKRYILYYLVTVSTHENNCILFFFIYFIFNLITLVPVNQSSLVIRAKPKNALPSLCTSSVVILTHISCSFQVVLWGDLMRSVCSPENGVQLMLGYITHKCQRKDSSFSVFIQGAVWNCASLWLIQSTGAPWRCARHKVFSWLVQGIDAFNMSEIKPY